ncbi:hypothetical protein V1523DRAFT_15228 [Lipomyces doorenjongii]
MAVAGAYYSLTSSGCPAGILDCVAVFCAQVALTAFVTFYSAATVWANYYEAAQLHGYKDAWFEINTDSIKAIVGNNETLTMLISNKLTMQAYDKKLYIRYDSKSRRHRSIVANSASEYSPVIRPNHPYDFEYNPVPIRQVEKRYGIVDVQWVSYEYTNGDYENYLAFDNQFDIFQGEGYDAASYSTQYEADKYCMAYTIGVSCPIAGKNVWQGEVYYNAYGGIDSYCTNSDDDAYNACHDGDRTNL